MGETEKKTVLRLAAENGWTVKDHGGYGEVIRGQDYVYVTFSSHGDAVAISVRYGRIVGPSSLNIVLEYLRRSKW